MLKSFLRFIFVLIALALLIGFVNFLRSEPLPSPDPQGPQPPVTYPCPAGGAFTGNNTFSLLNGGQIYDQTTNSYRQWLCSSLKGRVFVHSGPPQIYPETIVLTGGTIVGTITGDESGQVIALYGTVSNSITFASGFLDGSFNLVVCEPTAANCSLHGTFDGVPGSSVSLSAGQSAFVTYAGSPASTFHVSLFGGSSGIGTVTSVCMNGDGTVYQAVVPGSCITTAGTLAPALQVVPAAVALMGPREAVPGAAAVIQSKAFTASDPTTINSVSGSFDSAVTAGHQIIAAVSCIGYGKNFTTMAPSTNYVGDTFGPAVQDASEGQSIATGAHGGPTTVTVNFTYAGLTACPLMVWYIMETTNLSGVIDQHRGNELDFASGEYGNDVTTTVPNDFILTLAANETPQFPTIQTANPVYTLDQTASNVSIGSGTLYDAAAPTTGDYAATYLTTGTHSTMQLVAYETSGTFTPSAPWVARRIASSDISAGLPLNSLQANNNGGLGGVPGSQVDFNTGSLTLAPVGTGAGIFFHSTTIAEATNFFSLFAEHANGPFISGEADGQNHTVQGFVFDGVTVDSANSGVAGEGLNVDGEIDGSAVNGDAAFGGILGFYNYASGGQPDETSDLLLTVPLGDNSHQAAFISGLHIGDMDNGAYTGSGTIAGVYIDPQTANTDHSSYSVKTNSGPASFGDITGDGIFSLAGGTAQCTNYGGDGFKFFCSDCDTPVSEGAACTAAGDHAGAFAIFVRGGAKCF